MMTTTSLAHPRAAVLLAPPKAPRRTRSPWVWRCLVAAIVVLALATRVVYSLRHSDVIDLQGYDSGVYYSAADSLVHGRLPYRNFLFVETPGIAVLVAPFALLGTITHDSVGYAAANLFFTVIGAANAGMVATVLRRFGLSAAIFGGVFYAVTDVAVQSERFIKLEPAATLLILIALVLLGDVRSPARRRHTLVAGILLGLACGFKIWYVVPVIVVTAALPGLRNRVRLFLAAAGSAAALMLPFFLAAPSAMFREVVVDQLGRRRTPVTVMGRLHEILGNPVVPHTVTRLLGLSVGEVTGGLGVLAAVATVFVLTRRSAGLYVWLLLSGMLVLFVAPSFFDYYTSLTSAPLALVLGVGFARLTALVSTRTGRLALTSSALVGLTLLNLPGQWHAAPEPQPSIGLRRAVLAVPGCVVSDNPEILAATDVLSRDLVRGCVVWPDVTGWTYDADSGMRDGVYTPRSKNQRWQRHVTGYLTSGAAVIAYRPETELDARSRRVLASGPELFHDGPWTLYATPRHTPA
ncbi:MAG TPA: hypothetical protein VFQ96_01660 [Microbacteriaceae bacterium]|nr:hypothetical protein [Microbacteriaceae bacterium]